MFINNLKNMEHIIKINYDNKYVLINGHKFIAKPKTKLCVEAVKKNGDMYGSTQTKL